MSNQLVGYNFHDFVYHLRSLNVLWNSIKPKASIAIGTAYVSQGFDAPGWHMISVMMNY